MAPSTPPSTMPDLPESIGPYRILEPLGEGGMGEVYKAEQREPVRRLVALKVIRQGMATKEVLARFELERRALAAMSHRSIAKVFDAGATEGGLPYFVMELVEGLPITDYCDKHRLELKERLRLFQQVCAAVQHAHQKGLIHRDLKPGNVLVVREGDDAVPKVLDFGLVKATNRDLLSVTLATEKDRILGTPEYMAPEQAAGDGEVIDVRADVYSLGVILYELLSGTLPFTTEELRSAGQLEALRIIREKEPTKPSTRLASTKNLIASVASRRRSTAAKMMRDLRGDLDWVVLKAISKEPERRFASANSLAEDIERFLCFEPTLASRPSLNHRLRKFCRRHRTTTIFTMVVAALLSASLVAIWNESRATQLAGNRALRAITQLITATEDLSMLAEQQLMQARERLQEDIYLRYLRVLLAQIFGRSLSMDEPRRSHPHGP